MKRYQCKKCSYSTDIKHEIATHYRWQHPKRKAGKQPKKIKPIAAEHASTPVSPIATVRKLKYCPCCGTNLNVITAALEMIENS